MRQDQDVTLSTLLEAMQNLNAKIERMENRLVEQVVEVKEEVTTVKDEIERIKHEREQRPLTDILFRHPASES